MVKGNLIVRMHIRPRVIMVDLIHAPHKHTDTHTLCSVQFGGGGGGVVREMNVVCEAYHMTLCNAMTSS